VASTIVWAARSHRCVSTANLKSLIRLPPVIAGFIIEHMYYIYYGLLSSLWVEVTKGANLLFTGKTVVYVSKGDTPLVSPAERGSTPLEPKTVRGQFSGKSRSYLK